MEKSILITGCSCGIGLASAELLKKEGFRVFASARQAKDVETLRAAGYESLQLDLDETASIESAVKAVFKQTGGRLFGLVNNGAFAQPGAVEDLTRVSLVEQFQTNVFGTQELTNLVLPAMRRAGAGRVVQISSVLGFSALPYRGAYCASKYALEGLSDAMRLELHGSGVYVALVEPGPVDTKIRENAYRAWQRHTPPLATSAHRERYEVWEKRLQGQGPSSSYSLPPEDVAEKVLAALSAPRPKERYYVCTPTYVTGWLKRLLSTRMLDRLLYNHGESEYEGAKKAQEE